MAITFQDIMNFATVNRENYEQLKQQIQRGTVIPFVGAGLSACVYPDWRKALKMIADDVMDLSAKASALRLLSGKYVNEHEDALEQAAKYLENIWTKSVFDNKLYHIFSPEKLGDAEVTETLHKEAVAVLPKLFSQGVVLTTNYDHVLEEIYRTYGKGIDTCDVLHRERLNKRLREMSLGSLLIKLHGDVEEASTSIILNKESYDRAYQDGSPLIAALHKCYGMKSMLFLGCSLEHDRTMDELQKILEPGSLHFTVFSCEKDGAALQNTIKHMGKKNILPILYPKGQYECVRLVLEQLLMELDLKQYNQLPIKLRECGSGFYSIAERLAPETRTSEFCGRNIEYSKLVDFCLGGKDNFLWWAVTGDGGTGKSRIAVELSIDMRKKGWNVIWLRKYKDYQSFNLSNMQSGINTLFILDRVIGYEAQIGDWIEERYHQSKGTIVRVLLIERKNDNFSQNGWIEQILNSVEMPGILEDHCYNRQMLELQPMDKKDMKHLIISYGGLIGENQSFADEIMEQLEKIDPDRTRPLYAILLIEVWKRGSLNKIDTRNKLLEYILKAEFSRYQTYFSAQNRGISVEAKARAKAFCELKLAATLLNGLELDKIQKYFSEEWEIIADTERARKMIIGDLEENQKHGIAALQPDLMADYYIISEVLKNEPGFEDMFLKCWDINSIECFTRIINVISDFPERLDILKRVLDMPLNISITQQSNMYGLLLTQYALLQNDLSDTQCIVQKLLELMKTVKENVGLKYPLAICITKLCCGMNTFEEKWKYIRALLELGYTHTADGKNTIDMMLANKIGSCLASCYEISLTESEFQKVERERKKLLSEIRPINPLYFYLLGAMFGKSLLTFYMDHGSIQADLLVSLLKELLIKIDKDEGVRLIYIHIYILGLLLQLEKQPNSKKAKRIWYQIDELYNKEVMCLIEKMNTTDNFLPIVFTAWSFREKSLELILRNIYENDKKMVENMLGEESQIHTANEIKYCYTLAMELFIRRADDASISDLLERLKFRYESASENRKADGAFFYSAGLTFIYDHYAWRVFCGEMQITDEYKRLFHIWEIELNLINETYHSEQIHKNWLEVLTTSTFIDQDITVIRNKVKIIEAEYEANKEKKDNAANILRKQYSMSLNNLCRVSKKRSECREIIRLQWKLFDESNAADSQEEALLCEIAKTINNTVKTANSLEECQMYAKEIQKILSFDIIQSEETKDKILLEYGKSLVNSFAQVSPDMAEQRQAYIKELESLYWDSKQRNSDLKDQFLIRWMLGLNNAASTCQNRYEAQEYLMKLEKLNKLWASDN